MDRDSWCDDFVDELLKLRPHISHKLARTMAPHHYHAKADSLEFAYTLAYMPRKGAVWPAPDTESFIGAGEKSRTPDLRITNAGELVFALIHRR
jgi:hypothetical protein